MHYHLLQRNSMTVPRVDDKDYALAMDGYGINTGKWTHERDSRCYRMSWEQKLARHVLDHGDTVDLAYGTGSYDCVIAIIKPNVDGQIGNSARWNIPDSVPAWKNPFGLIVISTTECLLHLYRRTPRQRRSATNEASGQDVGTDSEAS